jgi:hypothetical protein
MRHREERDVDLANGKHSTGVYMSNNCYISDMHILRVLPQVYPALMRAEKFS